MPIIIIPPYRPASGGGGGSGTDPNFANVKSLLHFNGTNGSTTFTDVRGTNSWSVQVGSPTISTTQSKFGGASLRLPDTGRNIISCTNANLASGSADVTLEFWVYMNAISSWQYFTDSGDSNTFLTAISGGDLQLYQGGWRSLGCAAVTATTWTHIAYVRSSGVWSGFVNGVKGSSTYSYSGAITVSNKLCIGAQLLGGPAYSYGMNGYMDDFRLTIGTARYTANFTPSASAFPDS